MKKKITLTLTREEANAVINGLESALQFWDIYYMFAPKEGNLNEGNHVLDEKRRALAYRVIESVRVKFT